MPKLTATITLTRIEWDTSGVDAPAPGNLPQQFEHQTSVSNEEIAQPANQLLEALTDQAIDRASDHHHFLIHNCHSSVRFH